MQSALLTQTYPAEQERWPLPTHCSQMFPFPVCDFARTKTFYVRVTPTDPLTSIVVPGAGEPNYDSFENDPLMNAKQRRENEVQTLLSKLSHEMIGLGNRFLKYSITYLSVYLLPQKVLYFE